MRDFEFAKATEGMTAEEVLNYYRNLYHAESQSTEHGIVANALNDILPRMIVPPCKVGDTVYQPSYKFTKCSAYDYAPRFIEDSSCFGCGAKCDSVKEPYIYEGTVVSIRITKEQNFLAVSFQEKFDSSSFILGKTVFLTREEAEQALKGEHHG